MSHFSILHVVGARPNFVKAAPVIRALSRLNVQQVLVHTGQHYDANMSDVFFRQLALREPDINLYVGSGSHAVQTAEVMVRFERVVHQSPPDLVMLYGDVNSTMAAALVCAKLGIRVGHVEAGLRSFDRTMPEEINRLVTDQIANLLFTPSSEADENLVREGVCREKIHLVGNVMIDTLVRLLPATESCWNTGSKDYLQIGDVTAHKGDYIVVTLHRPSNVDDLSLLKSIMDTLAEISRRVPVIFPIHPRTRLQMDEFKDPGPGLQFLSPLGYLEFLALERHAMLVITDSGGIQEETTFLGIPCLTVRKNTERPSTVTLGTNQLVGHDMLRLREEVQRILAGDLPQGKIPPLWDGRASERISEVVCRNFL